MNERQFQAWLADRAPATVPASLRARVERISAEIAVRPAERIEARPRSQAHGPTRRRWLALGLAAAVVTGSAVAAGALLRRPDVAPLSGNGAIVVTTGSGAMAFDPVAGSAVPIDDLGIDGESLDPTALDAALDLAWSPDGRFAAYTTATDVRVLDLASGTSSRLATLDSCGSLFACGVTWSPDGRMVAFTSGNTLRVVDLAGGTTSIRATLPTSTFAPDWMLTSPTWSPDGRSIVFVQAKRLFVVQQDGTGLTQLLDEGRDRAGPIDPRWSPDGSKIGFVSSDLWSNGPWHIQIVVVDPDGSNRRSIGQVGECWCMNFLPSGFAWSPDGTQIAFISPGYIRGKANKPALPDPGLHIASVDGSSPRLIYREIDGDIAWRPVPSPAER